MIFPTKPGKKGKTLKRARSSSQGKKQGTQQQKTRKGRTGLVCDSTSDCGCDAAVPWCTQPSLQSAFQRSFKEQIWALKDRVQWQTELNRRLSLTSADSPLIAQQTKRLDEESFRQTKPKKAYFANRFAKKGCFCEFEVFFRQKKQGDNSPKNGDFHEFGGFCEFSLFFHETKHSEFTKTPLVREPAREYIFFWFGLPEQLLTGSALKM